MTEENKDIYISYWLLLITFLVAIMIVIGGLTRLTDSGLSITRWDLISGILPPINLLQWENSFALYKAIPEYKLLNKGMTLDEFKVIYWWEFAHRLLGRLIGLFYILPLLYFTFKKMVNKSLVHLYIIFLLISLQGAVGWYMVQSGLTENTDVSHYRLSLHLTLAFVIFILLLWNYLKFRKKYYNVNKKLPFFFLYFFFICLIFQISLGALVSGLDAGQIYQTWPLMDQSYFPDDSNIKNLFNFNSFESASLVQFMHRNMAYLIFLLFCIILLKVFKDKDLIYLRKNTLIVFLFLLFQIFLGIITIVSGAHILIASMHQISSIFLVSASLILIFKNSKIN